MLETLHDAWFGDFSIALGIEHFDSDQFARFAVVTQVTHAIVTLAERSHRLVALWPVLDRIL